MAQLDIEVPHRLEQAEAFKRVRGISVLLKKQYAEKIRNLNEQWENNRGKLDLSVMSHTISLTVDVTKNSVRLSADLPFAASFFRSKIENTIREKLVILLQPDLGHNKMTAGTAIQLPKIKSNFSGTILTVGAALVIVKIITEIFCEKKIGRNKAKDAARVIYGI